MLSDIDWSSLTPLRYSYGRNRLLLSHQDASSGCSRQTCPPWIPNLHDAVFVSNAHFLRLTVPASFWGLRRPLCWPDWALSGSAAQRNLGWDLQEWYCSCKPERGWITPRWGQWPLHPARSWGPFDHTSTKEKVALPSRCSRARPVPAYHSGQCALTYHSFEASCCTSNALADLKAWQYYLVHL